jgi:hypothetical protein
MKVSWDDDIPNIWKIIQMFQTTNQYIYILLFTEQQWVCQLVQIGQIGHVPSPSPLNGCQIKSGLAKLYKHSQLMNLNAWDEYPLASFHDGCDSKSHIGSLGQSPIHTIPGKTKASLG